MPKASSTATVQQASPPTHPAAPNILKRNQACHQCRRRKLKCDARRPCATCIRSHANARATAGVASVPPEPECTYDEIPEPRQPSHDAPKNRYERLESRINELENLLRQKNSLEEKQQLQDSSYTHKGDAHVHEGLASSQYVTEAIAPPYVPSHTQTTAVTPSFGVIDYSSPHYISALPASHSVSSYDASSSAQNSRHPSPPTAAGTGSPDQNAADLFQELFWPSWPARLPSPDMLMHMVEVFFVSFPHACRILHRPSFITSLSLNPTDTAFPASSVLHSICAVASLFTSAVLQTPQPNLDERPAEEIFQEKYRRRESRDDSFGEMQAKYAKDSQEEAKALGEGLFSTLQSVVILSWYHFYHARWVDVWESTGEAMRGCTPLMLNMCAPQLPLARSWQAERPFIAPPRTNIEEETRRNTFWLAYAMDRFHSSGTDFAMLLDDEDITQVLPCTGCAFLEGSCVPLEQRQRINTPRMLTTHPHDQTDSFVLYIKAAILLSKVKLFNHRFRSKYHSVGGHSIDPRETPAFMALDGAISAFHAGFPREFCDPLPNGVVDPHLYMAHLAPPTAVLLLHDPHANFLNRDWSYEKLTAAAHAILDLVYLVCSTNYDLALLDPMVMWCWHWAARELVREMLHMQQMGQVAQVAMLRSEVEVIRLALARAGERIPIGYRQTKILDDLLAQEVPAYAQPYTIRGLEEVDPGSLEQLLYEGMQGLR